MMYWATANRLLRMLYPGLHWKVKTGEKKLYLTFDDGPHPAITSYVLDLLKQYHARASFFCIGKNVVANPDVYARILEDGHAVGNHTMNHRNGWKTDHEDYFDNIRQASAIIDSRMFRPPYGRIRRFQANALKSNGWEIVMWSLLSGDFDITLSPPKCWDLVRKHAGPGSIIVFHDSEKAYDRLAYALPRTLETFSQQGYTFEKLTMDILRKDKE
ncbi:polysaccharide deacetylase family protein [Flavihumibacter rivuli]|uniref:polysaccharide deacetylase family protein n=1 Tax=Flavihumibacter rivuli TaxID=2838156 RepID=UPI001BDF0F13|nr:polysaccharide deacetylase family protein [Flavihumibacter rivuli]ULQ54960.1 polysaccharide deacetylase family protein [Flavihumibacter rivuli]